MPVHIPGGEYVVGTVEAATLVPQSEQYIRLACSSGQIPGAINLNLGGNRSVWLIPVEALMEWSRQPRRRGRPPKTQDRRNE